VSDSKIDVIDVIPRDEAGRRLDGELDAESLLESMSGASPDVADAIAGAALTDFQDPPKPEAVAGQLPIRAEAPPARGERPRGEQIHIKRLFGGKQTAEEVWRRFAFDPGERCECGGAPAARFICMLSARDVQERAPQLWAAMVIRRATTDQDPLIPTRYGLMLRVGVTTPCEVHIHDAEKAAAAGEKRYSRAGMNVLLEFQYGPGKDKPFAAVPGRRLIVGPNGH